MSSPHCYIYIFENDEMGDTHRELGPDVRIPCLECGSRARWEMNDALVLEYEADTWFTAARLDDFCAGVADWQPES